MEKLRFNKHYVKRDPSNNKMMFDNDGNAVPGDFIRDTTITEGLASELNSQSKHHGTVWVKAEKEAEVKSGKRVAIEKEAEELGVKYRENISDEKLQEKINKTIEN